MNTFGGAVWISNINANLRQFNNTTETEKVTKQQEDFKLNKAIIESMIPPSEFKKNKVI